MTSQLTLWEHELDLSLSTEVAVTAMEGITGLVCTVSCPEGVRSLLFGPGGIGGSYQLSPAGHGILEALVAF